MDPQQRIDLNADVGEAFGNFSTGWDEALLPLVSSVNIACGFHAGDPRVMQQTVAQAAELNLAIGAHPSYPDLVGFGRRFIDATPDEITCDVLYQIGALAAFCRATGVPLCHVKAHGALYNRAAVDEATAQAIIDAVCLYDRELAVLAPPGSSLLRLAREAGLPALAEVFADRAINPDGTLVSRRLPDAMIENPDLVAERVVRMVLHHSVTAIDGTEVEIRGDTICLHGDAHGAVARARAIREALAAAGIVVAAPHARRNA
jgi:UPF0271 protein